MEKGRQKKKCKRKRPLIIGSKCTWVALNSDLTTCLGKGDIMEVIKIAGSTGHIVPVFTEKIYYHPKR